MSAVTPGKVTGRTVRPVAPPWPLVGMLVVLVLPLVVVAARLSLWWLVVVGSLVAMAGAVLVLGVRLRFEQLRDDNRGYSPFPLMLRVLVVTLLGAAVGIATAVSAVLADLT